jgi:hypothetical protein
MPAYHIAQVNIGRVRYPTDDPRMAGFMTKLDEINVLAERSPGFVWRLQTPAGNATYLRPYDDDDSILINMSVWESVETLRHREEWFEKFKSTYLALWWVPVGHLPGVDEAVKRIAHLDAHGPTQFAFTFKHVFQPDDEFQRGIDWSSFMPCPAT